VSRHSGESSRLRLYRLSLCPCLPEGVPRDVHTRHILLRAWSLYQELSYLPDSDVVSAGSHAHAQLKRVLSILGRSHSQLGGVRKASLSFALGVQFRVELAGTLWLSPRLIFHQLEFAQSLHLQGDHHDAIEIIQDVIASLDDRPTVSGAVNWLYYSSDSGDDDSEDAAIADHAPSLYSLYRSLPRIDLCPWLLLGRCHVALGRYSSAVDYLARSRREVSHRDSSTLTANVEFSYTVASAAREYCLSEARVRTIHPFINWLVAGPALSDAIIEFRLLRLLASACVAVGCASGSVQLGLSFNAHLDVIDVWQIQSDFHHCLGLFSVEWYAVDPQYRDIRGYPVAMALSVPRLVFGTSRVTTFTVNFFVASPALGPCTPCLRPYSRVMCVTLSMPPFAVIQPSLVLSWSVLSVSSGSPKNMVYATCMKILPFSWLLADYVTWGSNRVPSMSSKLSCKIRLMLDIVVNVGGVINIAMIYSSAKGVVCRTSVDEITSGWPGNALLGYYDLAQQNLPSPGSV